MKRGEKPKYFTCLYSKRGWKYNTLHPSQNICPGRKTRTKKYYTLFKKNSNSFHRLKERSKKLSKNI